MSLAIGARTCDFTATSKARGTSVSAANARNRATVTESHTPSLENAPDARQNFAQHVGDPSIAARSRKFEQSTDREGTIGNTRALSGLA